MQEETRRAMEHGKHAENNASGAVPRAFLSIVIMAAMVVVVTVLLRLFVFVPYEIPSGSMEDTIKTGDMVFSEKISYYMHSPEYGDIVTFADPEVAGRVLIKRVIATEGQVVALYRTANGVDVSFPYTVPEGEIWVMGDNRTSSQDSRYFGSVKLSSVTGRAAFIYWPVSDVGFL